jgi:hypothetical protein
LISDSKKRTSRRPKHVASYLNRGTAMGEYKLIEDQTVTGKGKYWARYCDVTVRGVLATVGVLEKL